VAVSKVSPDDGAASSLLRGMPVALMGSGLGSVSFKGPVGGASYVLQAVARHTTDPNPAVPLTDVEKTWNDNTRKSRVTLP